MNGLSSQTPQITLVPGLESSATAGSAISIKADNVVIDLGSWLLDGVSAGLATGAIGIYALGRKNITIRNGTVRGFYRGILFSSRLSDYSDSTGHLVEHIRAVDNTHSFIRAEGIGVIVRHNHIVGTGGSTNSPDVYALGIEMYGSGCRLLDNDIVHTSAMGTGWGSGIWLNNCSDAVISNNRVDNVSTNEGQAYGIYAGSSENLIIDANSVTSAERGISTGSSGKFRDNLTSNVTEPFLGGATDAGGNN